MTAATVKFRSGAATSAGPRPINQDSFTSRGPWFVVADGVGGHQSGEIASRVAIDVFDERPPPDSTSDVADALRSAHSAVLAEAGALSATDMATTVVGVVPVGDMDRMAVFHVGDSRCYRLIDGNLSLLTVDHSLVHELVSIGRLSPDQVDAHPNRHVISRALGMVGAADPDVSVIDPRGTRLLLCSDGVSDTLAAASIGRILAGIVDPQEAAERLIELARQGRDNATAVVVDVS